MYICQDLHVLIFEKSFTMHIRQLKKGVVFKLYTIIYSLHYKAVEHRLKFSWKLIKLLIEHTMNYLFIVWNIKGIALLYQDQQYFGDKLMLDFLKGRHSVNAVYFF